MRPALAALLAPALAAAGEAGVLEAEATRQGEAWRFSVTVAHSDEGWDHYADAKRVVGPDGTIYGTRTLHHPHVEEQPFTRSLSGVAIPEDVAEVTIEARDSVHGWGGAAIALDLATGETRAAGGR
jgi:hypothetical protein